MSYFELMSLIDGDLNMEVKFGTDILYMTSRIAGQYLVSFSCRVYASCLLSADQM